MGPSGSGKDTQTDLIEDRFNIRQFSTGDMLRAEAAKDTEKGNKIKKYLEEGKWVPTEITYELLEEKFLNGEIPHDNIMLNGVVRIPNQVEKLDKILAKFGKTLDVVISFTLEEEEAIQRMLGRGRQDDKVENIRSRLKEYDQYFDPIFSAYRDRGILKEIDAGGTIEGVHKKVVDALNIKD